MDSAPRSQNGFLSSLTADDFELIRPHLRAADLSQDMVLVEVDETLKRAYMPHKGVISLVVNLARGEQVQIAMIGKSGGNTYHGSFWFPAPPRRSISIRFVMPQTGVPRCGPR